MAISPDVIERAHARVGRVLGGKYRLDRLLGIGGMAAVYEATHRNKKRVAVKMLHPELCIDVSVKSRFLREGYAANTVDHSGAVAVFDDDVTDDGSAFLVMELLAGETLDSRVERKGGSLPLSEVLPLTDQLLDVLAAAHEKGLVHRDIKPENLFLTTNGQLKVLDFGIARLRELSSTDDKSTGIGSFMGTPAFMSPEQARGRWDDVDPRSDVWAVGATIFYLLSGRSVHETESVGEQLVMAATVPAPPLISVVPQIEPLVAELVDRALAFDKAARWSNVAAMQTALRQAIAVVAPAGALTVPKTSLPIVDIDRDAETLAITDMISHRHDSRPSVPNRVSHGGSIPSPVTSRTGSGPADTPRRGRALMVAGIAAAAALATVLLWPRTPSPEAAEPAAGVAPEQPAMPEPPAPRAKLEQPVIAPVPEPVAAPDAGLSDPPAARAPAKAKAKPAAWGVPARPPVSAAAADTAKPAASPDPTAKPGSRNDPLSKRY